MTEVACKSFQSYLLLLIHSRGRKMCNIIKDKGLNVVTKDNTENGASALQLKMSHAFK